MNPSYLRVRVPKEEALHRFAAWKGLAAVGPLVPTTSTDAVRLACDEQDQWRGQAVFVSEVGGWTVLGDLTGGLSAITSADWRILAADNDLVFAGSGKRIAIVIPFMVQLGDQVLASVIAQTGTSDWDSDTQRLKEVNGPTRVLGKWAVPAKDWAAFDMRKMVREASKSIEDDYDVIWTKGENATGDQRGEKPARRRLIRHKLKRPGFSGGP